MSEFSELNQEHISQLQSLVSQNNSYVTEEDVLKYSQDHTEDLIFKPGLVLVPENKLEIAKIAEYCNKNRIPLTVRGAGTGLSGGCLPVQGGVVLSTEKLNKIISISSENYQAIVEPGVINEELQNAVQELGMFYPPDPASKGSCTLGGNIAHSSGGPRCVKYGTTKDYVLNLEVVLADGSIIHTGANVLKNSTGYNLTQLMIGSEGTLGIVVAITLRLIPYPPYKNLLLAKFKSATEACACVSPVFSRGIQPSAMEFMDKKGVEISAKATQTAFETGEEEAYLLIELDGFSREQVSEQAEKTYEVLDSHGSLEVLFADEAESMEKLWKIRRAIGETVKNLSVYKEEDTVVTRANLALLYEGVEKIAAKNGFTTVCYGHAGDGNLHINILKMDMDEEKWKHELPDAIREIFRLCVELGGTISGEHGIGWVQKPYMDIVMTETHFALLRGIKKTFDPNGILNPGKIF